MEAILVDPVRKYLDATRQLDEITDELNSVIAVVGTVAEALKTKPGRFMFSDVVPELPPEIVLGHATRVEGDKWPAAERIQSLLLAWHSARKQVMAAWGAVHKVDQAHLRAPEH